MSDASDLERQREHFNAISQRYREARSHENHKLLKDLMWEYFFARHPELERDGAAVLEAMCGYAEGFDILSQHLRVGFVYHGFDYSDDVVAYMNEHRPELHVFHQDVTSFEPGREYDLVIVLGGFHHVPSRCEEAVACITRAIAPGGFLLNLEPTHGFFLTRWVRERIYDNNDLFDEQTERAFEVDDYFDLFERHGLSLRDAVYPGLLSYILFYNPDAFPWLNVGGPRLVTALFKLEAPWLHTPLARVLSFATLSLWQKRAS